MKMPWEGAAYLYWLDIPPTSVVGRPSGSVRDHAYMQPFFIQFSFGRPPGEDD